MLWLRRLAKKKCIRKIVVVQAKGAKWGGVTLYWFNVLSRSNRMAVKTTYEIAFAVRLMVRSNLYSLVH